MKRASKPSQRALRLAARMQAPDPMTDAAGADAPQTRRPPIKIHRDLVQGSDEWLAARCGVLTASDLHRIITPAGKVADSCRP